jgi:hypothetical protein
MVINPVISQASSIHPGDPRVRDISAVTMNIPDPIMDPTTMADESKRFKLRLKVFPVAPSIKLGRINDYLMRRLKY